MEKIPLLCSAHPSALVETSSAKLHPLPRNAPGDHAPKPVLERCAVHSQRSSSSLWPRACTGSRDGPVCRNPRPAQVSAALCVAQPPNSHAKLPVSGKPGSWEGSSGETLREESMPDDVTDTPKGAWHLAEENSPLLCRTTRTGEFPDPDLLACLETILPRLSTAWSWGIHPAQDRVLDSVGCHGERRSPSHKEAQGKAYVGERSPGDITHLGIQCLVFRALGPEVFQSNRNFCLVLHVSKRHSPAALMVLQGHEWALREASCRGQGGPGEPELMRQGRRNWGCLEKIEGKQHNRLQIWRRRKEENKPFPMSGVGGLWTAVGRLALDGKETF